MCFQGVTTTICDNRHWDSRDAAVVCWQLGLPSFGTILVIPVNLIADVYNYLSSLHCTNAGAFPVRSSYYARQTFGIILTENFHCFGDESHILNCTHSIRRSRSSCSHAVVQCPCKCYTMCIVIIIVVNSCMTQLSLQPMKSVSLVMFAWLTATIQAQ